MASTLYPVTNLDYEQVIQHIYDESTQSLRSTAVATISGSVQVEIDAADGDNIAISDGVDTLVINADGSINLGSITGPIALPTGAATSANQVAANALLTSIAAEDFATETTLAALNAKVTTVDTDDVRQASHDNLNANANIQVGNVDVSGGNPVPISAASLPLPTGASTLAEQQSQTALLTTIDGDTSTLAGTVSGGAVNVQAINLDIRDLVFATDKVDVSGSTLGANSGVDIGDVTINNAAGASAVNIQDGGNSITVDGTVTIIDPNTATSSITRVAASAASVNLIGSNASRKCILLFNDSSVNAYVKYGTTASTISFTIKMFPESHHFIDGPIYTGAVDAIWDSATGAMQVTEL